MFNPAHIISFPNPKPKKNNLDTLYRPISLIFALAKTLMRSILPYITNGIHISLHNTIVKETASLTKRYTIEAPPLQQTLPKTKRHARTITVAFYMNNVHKSINPKQTTRPHIQPYLHSIHAWNKSNNLILNSGKTTCTNFTSIGRI